MNNYLSMLSDTLFGFVALFTLTKILGKTQINQLTPFDFISALILGELVGNALFDKEAGIAEIAFVISLWGALLYLTEIITQKWKSSRAFLEGSPDIIIYKGKLIRDTMKKSKLDLNHLQHLLREKDVFSIQDVEYAILETNGKVSVLKKAAQQTPTKQDLKVATHDVHLATTLINDGEIIFDNLKEKNLTEEWLIEELHKQDYSSPKEVFYAEYIKDKQLFLLPFTNRGHKRFK
ncbi:hypothetical protein OBCHQ24_06515 [Oceanobacillus iheyensis]|nr:hypothetical protein OBCHQ24_06515 [Oceanobacillus iheyensis]